MRYTRLQVGYTGNLKVTGSLAILLHPDGIELGLPLRRSEIFGLQLGALIPRTAVIRHDLWELGGLKGELVGLDTSHTLIYISRAIIKHTLTY